MSAMGLVVGGAMVGLIGLSAYAHYKQGQLKHTKHINPLFKQKRRNLAFNDKLFKVTIWLKETNTYFKINWYALSAMTANNEILKEYNDKGIEILSINEVNRK
jgi:hypothetical protein